MTVSRILLRYFLRVRAFLACLARCSHFLGTMPQATDSKKRRTALVAHSTSGFRASTMVLTICRSASAIFSKPSRICYIVSGETRRRAACSAIWWAASGSMPGELAATTAASSSVVELVGIMSLTLSPPLW